MSWGILPHKLYETQISYIPSRVSCTSHLLLRKTEQPAAGEEDFDLHSTWTDDSTNNFWDKQYQTGSSQSDTAWNGDTAIII